MEVGDIMCRLIFDTASTLNWFKCNDTLFKDYGFLGKFLEWSDHRCPKNDDKFRNLRGFCAYSFEYLDDRKAVGVLAKERFGDPVNAEIDVGCSYNYSEDFGKVEGILGMSRGSYSFISQIPHQHGSRRGFSFCIVSDMEDIDDRRIPTSYLRIGRASMVFRSGAHTLAMLEGRVPNQFYDIKLSGISVGSQEVVVPDGTFDGGCVLDTATGVTHLAADAFDGLLGRFDEIFTSNGYFRGLIDTTALECYYPELDSPEHDNKIELPSVEVRFKDISDQDVTMIWGERQLFAPDKEVEGGICLQIKRSKKKRSTTIGAFQMAYIHFDFDLEKNQIRFKQSFAASCQDD